MLPAVNGYERPAPVFGFSTQKNAQPLAQLNEEEGMVWRTVGRCLCRAFVALAAAAGAVPVGDEIRTEGMGSDEELNCRDEGIKLGCRATTVLYSMNGKMRRTWEN